MNREGFLEMMSEEFSVIRELNEKKGHDYAGDEDPFSNFRRLAASLGLTKEQIWGVYCSKHWESVMTFCREGQVESEPIEERLRDVILYCLLLMGMIRDGKEKESTTIKVTTPVIEGGAIPSPSMSPALKDILEGFRGHAINEDTLVRARAMIKSAGFEGEVGIGPDNTLSYKEVF